MDNTIIFRVIFMVKIFYIPFSIGNTAELLFKEAIKHVQPPDYSKIAYLAPSSVKIEDTRKKFHKLISDKYISEQCYIPPEMTTISQHCKSIYNAYGSKRIVSKSLIPVIISLISGKGLGFSSLIADLIHDLKKTYPGRDAVSLKSNFNDIFFEMNIPGRVAETVEAGLEIFQQYQTVMENSGLIDDDDVMNYISNLLLSSKDSLPVARCSLLILEGFYDPTASEKNTLKALIHSAENALISVPYDLMFKPTLEEYINFLKENFAVEEVYIEGAMIGMKNKFTYCCYPSIEEEVEGICRSIKSLYISSKHKDLEDIIVAFPVLKKYRQIAIRVFKKYGIPCNMLKKEPIGKTAPFLDLFCLLDSIAEDYPRLMFSQFLSSSYFAKIPEKLKKWIPSLCLYSGIISSKQAWLNFISGGSEIIDTSRLKEKDALEKDLKWVFKKLQPLENIKNKATFDAYAGLIRDIIDDFGFLVTDSDDDNKNDFFIKGIRNKVSEIFEQLSFIGALKKSHVKLTEFIEIVKYILNASYAEFTETGVRVMDFTDAADLFAGHIYLGGLTDEDMPSKTSTDYLLSDNVKKRMGLLSLEKHLNIQRFNFYRIVGLSSEKTELHLSYPLSEGDDMFLPSSFLYFGEEIKKHLPGVFSKEEYLLNIGLKKGTTPFLSFPQIRTPDKGSPTKALGDKPRGQALGASISEIDGIRCPTFNRKMHAFIPVTDIDAYRACPRKFFIEKVLRLRPSNIKEYDVEASTIGKIAHRIMERIIKEPFDNLQYLKHRAEEIAEEVIQDKKIDNYWKKLIKGAFIEILPDIYKKELELRKDGYVPAKVEITVNGEPVKGIRLAGKIDRVDMLGSSVRIIDYKTGTSVFNCKQVLEGNENLQLFLYASILKNQGYNIDKVGLYSLKDINVKWCPPSKGVKRQASSVKEHSTHVDDYIIESLKFLEETVREMRKGNFRAIPLNDYICWHCHEYAFCPYIQQ